MAIVRNSWENFEKWCSEFLVGRKNVWDAAINGRPRSDRTPRYVSRIKHLIKTDEQITIWDIAWKLEILYKQDYKWQFEVLKDLHSVDSPLINGRTEAKENWHWDLNLEFQMLVALRVITTSEWSRSELL